MAASARRAAAEIGEALSLENAGSGAAPEHDPPDRRTVMTRSLALVLFAGGLLALAWLVLPHSPNADDLGVAIMAASTLACGTLLLALPARLASDALLNGAVAAVTLSVSVALYFLHARDSDFELFYVWAMPYAYFFFSLRQALVHTAWLALCFAVVLTLQMDDGGAGLEWSSQDLSRLVLVLGTVLIVGLLVRRLAGWMRESEVRFRQGFDGSPLGIALVSLDLRYLDVNAAFCQLLGRPPEQIIGHSYEEFCHPDDLDVVRREAVLAQSRGGRSQQAVEKRQVRPDGTIVPVAVHTALVRTDTGRGLYLFTQVEDITVRLLHEHELERHAEQQAAVARLGEAALREADLDDLVGEVVRTITAILETELCLVVQLVPGREGLIAELRGRDGIVAHRRISDEPASLPAFTMQADGPVLIEDLRAERRFTAPALLSDHGMVSGITVAMGGRDQPVGVLGAYTGERRSFSTDEARFMQATANVLADAINRHRIEEATRHAALHDPLTGLPNRTLALDRIDHALHVMQREHTYVAVMVLDLDRFKIINDSLGHAAGDQVLLAIAPRLRDAVRPEDTVGRLGGDEFVVACERVNGSRDASALAERISATVNRPLTVNASEHFVSASIGIAVATTGDETPESLLRDADAAMYRAKERGRGRFEIFDERMREEVVGRLRTETELRRAVERGDLCVHYQPIVDLDSMRPVSVEALVRWRAPDGVLMSPDSFIPVAEETGLIADVGLWVLREACAQVAGWQRGLAPSLRLGVNASGRQIADPLFPAQVAEIARRSGLAPGSLAIEVTESVLIEDADAALAVPARLREHGLRLLLDDFGTGYSSLSYLKRLPLDALKVDRSFVQGLGVDPDDSAIVEAVIKLAQTLGLDVVAEGVETDRQLEVLRGLDCGHAQGYLFTCPLPAEELTDFLAGQVAA